MKLISRLRPLPLLGSLVCFLLLSGCSKPEVDPPILQFHHDADRLIQALQRYKEFAHNYPAGDLAAIARSLSGQNPADKILVMAATSSQMNARGELVDPWGSPLQFYFAENGVLIRSAGPNQKFEDSLMPGADDLYRTDMRR
jgi:hypothetical protein